MENCKIASFTWQPFRPPLTNTGHRIAQPPVSNTVFDPAQFMKVYNLSCDHDHRFEGWFSSENDCTSQLEQSRIECPVCESRVITKRLSAPRLNLSTAQQPRADVATKVQAQIMDMVRHVIAGTEDVGDRFAEEARRIHYNETSERPIRGVATRAECEALVEEGIDVTPLPVPAALKQTLQ